MRVRAHLNPAQNPTPPQPAPPRARPASIRAPNTAHPQEANGPKIGPLNRKKHAQPQWRTNGHTCAAHPATITTSPRKNTNNRPAPRMQQARHHTPVSANMAWSTQNHLPLPAAFIILPQILRGFGGWPPKRRSLHLWPFRKNRQNPALPARSIISGAVTAPRAIAAASSARIWAAVNISIMNEALFVFILP